MIKNFIIFMIGVFVGMGLSELAHSQDNNPAAPVAAEYQLLKFETTVCPACLRQNILFNNANVQQRIREKGVTPISVNLSDEKYKNLGKAWGVNRVPTLILVKVDKATKTGYPVRRSDSAILSTAKLLQFADPSAP